VSSLKNRKKDDDEEDDQKYLNYNQIKSEAKLLGFRDKNPSIITFLNTTFEQELFQTKEIRTETCSTLKYTYVCASKVRARTLRHASIYVKIKIIINYNIQYLI
jgi:hypothetical protein